MLSVIIPSRSPQYLQKTVNDLLNKAEQEIEVIIVFDGIWAESSEFNYNVDERVRIIHHGIQFNNYGMRASINRGMAIAKGNYVMKIDEHCMVDKGFDRKLKEDCEDDWVVIPRRKRLDPEKWENIKDRRPDIDYMFISFPFKKPNDKTCGLHGEIWTERILQRKDILIDETPSLQGSCYFMKKKYWDEVIGPLDEKHYGPFTAEAQEVGFKAWFSGGKVMRNKKTWYSHMHKGHRGKGYGFSNAQYKQHGIDAERGRKFTRDYWLTTKDYKYDFEWFINHFPNMPGWEGDWKKRIEEARKLETI